MLDIVDNATGGFPLLFVGLIEVICIIFVYGYQRFRRDIEMMIGATKFTRYMFYYFAPMWIVFTPLGLLAVIIFRCIQYEPLSVTTPDIFPAWADAIWWLIVIACFIAIPALFFVKFCKNGGNVVLHKVTSPSAAWRPQLSANCTGDYSKFAAVKSKKEQSPEKETEFDIHDIVAMPTLEAHLTATAREESEMTNGTVLETYDASGLGYDNMGYHRGYDVSEYKAHNAGFNQGNDKEEGTSESSARVHHPVATKL
ncbi:hypothetical protein DPMN_185424 [Dreissena polymorpha]|uniref:Uncharacterized protein n=2 Tax=Dreissena polymorpha TaxID=45954 RepID=A0A9D4DL03_DREPO|nr:hypothetical protein DPMN_185424 [Dreissena polymorpha]